MVNDNLERRGLYKDVFPVNSKTIEPSVGGLFVNSVATMPIPFDTAITPTRGLKKQYSLNDGKALTIKDEGFNFVIRMTSDDGFANLYAHITVGKPIIFSHKIDSNDTFTYPFPNEITKVTVSNSQISFDLLCKEVYSYDSFITTFTIKNSSKDFSNGIEGKVSVEAQNYFKDDTKGGNVRCPMYVNNASKVLILNFTGIKDLDDDKQPQERIRAFMKGSAKMNLSVTYYFNENSFLNIENPDTYLLQEGIKWKNVNDFSDKEYVELTLSLDSATDATDNYTGVNETNNLIVKIILPDEFRSLSPMTQEADGLAFSKGRITSKRFSKGVSLFSFADSTECVIPNPEDNTFSAKDKNGQILKGKVVGLELKTGNSAEALREQLASRKLNNTNKEYSFDIEGEIELDSIAWVTGKKNDFIKMIVPTQDSTGKEVFKVVNINIGEL